MMRRPKDRKGHRSVGRGRGSCPGLPPVCLLLVALAGAGCGGNLTAGGFSEVEVYVAGDDTPEGAVATAGGTTSGGTTAGGATAGSTTAGGLVIGAPVRHAGPTTPSPAAPDAASLLASATVIEGTVTATLRVEVMNDRREWTEVTAGPTTLTVPLVGNGPGSLLATRTLPPGRYVRSRITFQEVEADVVRGLLVDGLDLRGRVQVELAAASGLVVEEGLFLDLREGEAGRIVVALNSQLWLRLVNAVLRRVSATGFRQAVRVRVLGSE